MYPQNIWRIILLLFKKIVKLNYQETIYLILVQWNLQLIYLLISFTSL